MKTVFVISDLHLGGVPGFQICSPAGQKQLASFIRWAKDQHTPDLDIHLVLAGDIVDFLAEPEFAAFTADDNSACRKLENIFRNFADVWDALREFADSSAQLTLMLGNHDVELALPGPHRLMRERLGNGKIEFIYDNQALVDGPVLIEHGNRYDLWNAVPHNQLREVRSALSRKESPKDLPDIPGSRLVVEVMNDLKREYNFIDLLKPETHAALPLLAVLKPSAIWEIRKVVQLYRRARRVKFDSTGAPVDPGMIAAGTGTRTEDVKTENALKTAEELAGISVAASEIGAFDFGPESMPRAFINLWQAARDGDREVQIDRLYRALKTFAQNQGLAMDPGFEDEVYLKPARELAKRGFEVIVFGHTHLAKRVPLTAVNDRAVYLNSGTWADIIQLPSSLTTGEETVAKADLMVFADNLAENQLESWRTQLSSFVRIDMSGDTVKHAGVNYFRNHKLQSISGIKEN
jgi:UDP-2,3-diacylglucosamine pyrophosphatase LpxH